MGSHGKLHISARDGEWLLSILMNTGAMVHVAAQFWNELLVILPGVGTDVTDVGGYRARSVSHDTLFFSRSPLTGASRTEPRIFLQARSSTCI